MYHIASVFARLTQVETHLRTESLSVSPPPKAPQASSSPNLPSDTKHPAGWYRLRSNYNATSTKSVGSWRVVDAADRRTKRPKGANFVPAGRGS
jgi:hypothetical protein